MHMIQAPHDSRAPLPLPAGEGADTTAVAETGGVEAEDTPVPAPEGPLAWSMLVAVGGVDVCAPAGRVPGGARRCTVSANSLC